MWDALEGSGSSVPDGVVWVSQLWWKQGGGGGGHFGTIWDRPKFPVLRGAVDSEMRVCTHFYVISRESRHAIIREVSLFQRQFVHISV